MQNRLVQEEKALKSNETQLKQLQGQNNLLKLDIENFKKVISEQNFTIQNLEHTISINEKNSKSRLEEV